MDTTYLDWKVGTEVWLACAAMAVFAAFVTLSLARGMVSTRRLTAWRSLIGAASALGGGAWASHFVVMSVQPLPFALGYRLWDVAGVLLAGVVCFLVALRYGIGLGPQSSPRGKASWWAALAFGVAVCGAPVLAIQAIQIEPAVTWRPGLAVLGWGLCSALGGVGLALFSRRLQPMRWTLWPGLLGALLIGAGVVLGNAVVFEVARVPVRAWPLSEGGVPLSTLAALATVGVTVSLALLLLSSMLEERLRATLRRTRDELRRTAQTDRLTGLPNRAMFEAVLESEVAIADQRGSRLGLLFMNLDGLKALNESFGQACGDEVLREIGARLRQTLGRDGGVARVGGDEFLVMLRGDPQADSCAQLAQRLLAMVGRPCQIDGRQIELSASIGIAIYPEHGALSKLIAHACAAMKAAKRAGGAAHCFFEPYMVAGAREQVEFLQDLRRAVDKHELELYYQPKVDAQSGQITGVEALMRWNHAQRGMVSPAVFIPMAERFGLIQSMGNWLIDEVCRQVREWADGGLRMRVAFNLSVQQLRQADLADRVRAALQRHQVEASLLTCEITESAAMEDTRVTLAVLEQLSSIGLRVSVDDFGTGYSSLSYLRQLAAEELKIDRSFVLDVETSDDARAIVDAVVKLAQALGLNVVAEGVETCQQRDILRGLGCHQLQGFLYAKPMSARALALWALTHEGPAALDFRPSLYEEPASTALT